MPLRLRPFCRLALPSPGRPYVFVFVFPVLVYVSYELFRAPTVRHALPVLCFHLYHFSPATVGRPVALVIAPRLPPFPERCTVPSDTVSRAFLFVPSSCSPRYAGGLGGGTLCARSLLLCLLRAFWTHSAFTVAPPLPPPAWAFAASPSHAAVPSSSPPSRCSPLPPDAATGGDFVSLSRPRPRRRPCPRPCLAVQSL